MAHRSKVPKFGNWESEENVPYTVYFDKARKDRTGTTKMINPNDPEDNPDDHPSAGATPSQFPPPYVRSDQPDEFKGSPARAEYFGNRPANNGGGRRVSGGSEYSIENNNKSPLHNQASEYSIDRSPLHHQARASGRSSGSPSYESVKNSRDNSHSTPGRSRFGGASRVDEMDKGSTLPKFGEWDENNPASAEGYTHIFNKVREEKQTGQTNGPVGSPYRPAAATPKRNHSSDSMSCCFPWSRK